MNINQLINKIASSPNHDCKGTTRFTYKDGTLWFRGDEGVVPMITRLNALIICWDLPAEASTWSMNNRTSTDYHAAKTDVLKLLLDQQVSPSKGAVMLRSSVDPPIVSKLLSGPIIEKLVMDVNQACSGVGKSVTDLFEGLIRQLAYQTIKRENLMVEVLNKTIQQRELIATRSAVLAEQAQALIDTHCQPESGHTETGTPNYVSCGHLMGSLNAAKSLQEPNEILYNLIDSYQQLVERPGAYCWKLNEHHGISIDSPSNKYLDCRGMSNELYARKAYISGGGPRWSMGVSFEVMVTDEHCHSYSYYWVRDNIRAYIEAFRSIGIPMKMPFGTQPEEWAYESLAAPLFAAE